ncbi:hypothetical protein Nm8I071_28540 [Nonomuraea sp. TT08I-71]|nr:hypothetical protein Nm8I071_28540 [Nonomuraea sp. TT08I-71]
MNVNDQSRTDGPNPPIHAATLSLLTLDTAAWCGGFLGAAWTRYEFALTAGAGARVLTVALACAAVYAVLTLVRLPTHGRHPIGSAGEARGLAGTAATATLATLAVVLPWADRPVPASTPLLGGAVALVLMAAARGVWRARRLAAGADRPVDIVYTGLRPGEKLHEHLFGADEADSRPLHPLISHVRVPPLDPGEVRGLDPYTDPDELIKRLAALCETADASLPVLPGQR